MTLAISPSVVVDKLAQQLNGGLCVVLVNERHVHVVNEVHQAAAARGAVPHTRLLLQGLLQDDLSGKGR